MYEALRQRAPNSTRMSGVMTAVMLTMAAGYALSNGFAKNIVKLVEPATVVTLVEDRLETTPPPPPEQLKTEVDLNDTAEPPPITPPTWVVRDDTKQTITAKTGPTEVKIAPPPLPPAPVRKAPKLMPGPKPDYPLVSVRTQEQGTTELSVCVGANGRVSSASVASSSGHARLDDAALKWVRTSRFAPGTVDGVARDVCGHTVTYEWSLKDAGQ